MPANSSRARRTSRSFGDFWRASCSAVASNKSKPRCQAPVIAAVSPRRRAANARPTSEPMLPICSNIVKLCHFSRSKICSLTDDSGDDVDNLLAYRWVEHIARRIVLPWTNVYHAVKLDKLIGAKLIRMQVNPP